MVPSLPDIIRAVFIKREQVFVPELYTQPRRRLRFWRNASAITLIATLMVFIIEKAKLTELRRPATP
jgi:hypothetical protein